MSPNRQSPSSTQETPMAAMPTRKRRRSGSVAKEDDHDVAVGQQQTEKPPTNSARLNMEGRARTRVPTHTGGEAEHAYRPVSPGAGSLASNFFPLPSGSTPSPRPPAFSRPSPLTSFSYTPQHVQEFTPSALRYFVPPPIGARLGYGYERWVRRDDERGRIDSLLRAVERVREREREMGGAGGGSVLQGAVVGWRGVLTKVLTAPYEDRDGWELNVMLIDGTLYLEEHSTDARLREKNNMNERQRMQTYYGYAFEAYCTSDTPVPDHKARPRAPHAPEGWGGDVDTNVQWCSVVRTKLGDTRLILGGEVDCVRGKYTGQTDTFVELKTSLVIRGPQDEARFEKKLLKFYFQSFLLGVPEIVVGFRTPAGVVQTVQTFKTIELPRLVRGKPGAWDPSVCMDWGHRLLAFLRDTAVRAHGPNTDVWRATFVPGATGGIKMEVLDAAGVADVVNGEDRVGFLPRWYWDQVQRESERTPPPPPVRAGSSSGAPSVAKLGWSL